METIVCRVEKEAGRRHLEASVTMVGEDLVIAVGGGEKPHVGCAVLATPYPAKSATRAWSASCSVLTIPPHKEEPIARRIATHLAVELGRVAVVTAGVHDDNIDVDGIKEYLALGEKLAQTLSAKLTSIECR